MRRLLSQAVLLVITCFNTQLCRAAKSDTGVQCHSMFGNLSSSTIMLSFPDSPTGSPTSTITINLTAPTDMSSTSIASTGSISRDWGWDSTLTSSKQFPSRASGLCWNSSTMVSPDSTSARSSLPPSLGSEESSSLASWLVSYSPLSSSIDGASSVQALAPTTTQTSTQLDPAPQGYGVKHSHPVPRAFDANSASTRSWVRRSSTSSVPRGNAFIATPIRKGRSKFLSKPSRDQASELPKRQARTCRTTDVTTFGRRAGGTPATHYGTQTAWTTGSDTGGFIPSAPTNPPTELCADYAETSWGANPAAWSTPTPGPWSASRGLPLTEESSAHISHATSSSTTTSSTALVDTLTFTSHWSLSLIGQQSVSVTPQASSSTGSAASSSETSLSSMTGDVSASGSSASGSSGSSILSESAALTPASESSVAQSTTPAVAKTSDGAWGRWEEKRSWSNVVAGAVVCFSVILGWFA